MTRVTSTKLRRARVIRVNGREKIVGYLPPQPRSPIKCKACGKVSLLSPGQIKMCKHD